MLNGYLKSRGARRGVYLVYLLLPDFFPLALVKPPDVPNPSRMNPQLYATAELCVCERERERELGSMADGQDAEEG